MADKIFPITPKYTLIAKNKLLDKSNGSISIVTPQKTQEIISYFNKNFITVQELNTQVDVVISADTNDIEFYLKTSDGKVESKHGFLIEVFLSGNDGKLKRLYRENLQDPVDGNNILQDGFSNYFTLEEDSLG